MNGWYNIEEAAEFLGVEAWQIRDWLKLEAFPGAKRGVSQGKPWLIPESDLTFIIDIACQKASEGQALSRPKEIARTLIGTLKRTAAQGRREYASLEVPLEFAMTEFTEEGWGKRFDRIYRAGFEAGVEAYRKAILAHED